MPEPTVDEQISRRKAQERAFLQSAALDALDALDSRTQYGFIEAMNRVIRCHGGNIPAEIQTAWDRVLVKDHGDVQRLRKWLESLITPSPANGTNLIAQLLGSHVSEENNAQ